MFNLPANPYEILGVAKTAQIPEIRQAHRKLVLKCHPDKVSDPQQKAVKAEEFQKVQRAYEMLSNETERQKYDDMVRANQMEEENKRRRAEQAASYPTPGRTPPRAEPEAATYPPYKVRTAEPPPSFMRSNTMPTPSKGGPYSTRTPPHSYEEFSPDESREPRSARKAPPVYERESKREEERRRKKKEDEEWDRQLKKQEHRKREEAKERERRDKEKEKERREKEKRRAEKDRKRDTDDKRGRSKPHVDVQPVDDEREPHIVDAAPKSKSTSRPKHEHVVSDHEGQTSGAADKHRQNLNQAIQYLESSRSKGKPGPGPGPGLTRAQTYHPSATPYTRSGPPPAVETPPPANPAVAPPPPPPSHPVYVDEETVRRSSAKSSSRRMSHDTPRPRDKVFSSSHRKSSRQQASDDDVRSPPPLKKSTTMPTSKYAPPEVPESPPKMHRSQTDSYSRPIPGNPPTISRAQTWYAQAPAEDDYHRSRRYHTTTDEDSEDDRLRSRRRARSPEAMPRGATAVRYHVVNPTDGRAPRTRAMSPRSKPSKTGYYSSAEEPSWDNRASYDAYEASGGSGGGYYPHKVKYASYETPSYSTSTGYKATEHPASVYGY